jgi:hypothetical protein
MIMENFPIYFELALILSVIISLLLIVKQQAMSVGVLLLKPWRKKKG